MIERAHRPDLAEAALATLVLSAVAAFARSRAEPLAWLLLLPVLAASAFRLVRAPPLVQRWIPRATWLGLALLAAMVLNWLVSPTGQMQPAPPVPPAAGYGMALLCALLLLGRGLWPPARAAGPAALGMLVLAASQNGIPMRGAVALAALLSLVLLAAPGAQGSATGTLRRLLRFALFGFGAAGLAAAVAWFLPWAQPRVVQAAAQAAFPEAESGFSLETRLGLVEDLKLSPRVVLRVWADRPQKLRGAVATAFDGRSWLSVYQESPSLVPFLDSIADPRLTALQDIDGGTFLLGPPPRDVSLLSTRVLQVLPLPGALIAPAGAVLVRGPLGRVIVDANDILGPPAPAGKMYGVLNLPGFDPGSDPPPSLLAVPPDTDRRVIDLAARLAAGAPRPEERVDRTLAFLQRDYRYSLHVGAFHTRQPLAEFLFEKRRGWCQYFAGAAALLLRLEGVPTRLVTGFQLRPGLLRGGHYVVREADAHAWIEVYLPGRGWVEADPTPAAGYDEAHGGYDEGPWAEAWERLKGLGSRLWAAEWLSLPGLLGEELKAVMRRPWAPWLGLLAGAGLVVPLALALERRRRARRLLAIQPPSEARPELARLLADLDRAWARQGVPRPPSRGLLEHLESAAAARLHPSLRDASRRAVAAYYGARFGGAPPALEALAALERELSREATRTAALRSGPGGPPSGPATSRTPAPPPWRP